jgi:hypothetical protein
MLFPETRLLPEADPAAQVPQAQALTSLSLAALDRSLSPDALFRLTDRRVRAWNHLTLHWDPDPRDANGTPFSAPFRLEWVDAILFPQQVGLLLLKVSLDAQDLTVSRLRAFLDRVRYVLPPYPGCPMARWQYEEGNARHSLPTRDLLEGLLRGLAERDPELFNPRCPVGPVGRGISRTGRSSSTAWFSQGYGQVLSHFTYACLEKPAEGPGPAAGSGLPQESGLFKSEMQRALYELATCTDTALETFRPDASFLDRLWRRNRIALWANWQGLALQDGVVFLGSGKSRFLLENLPYNVGGHYLMLYVLVVFQKVRLSVMFGERVRREEDLHRNRSEATRLWDAFMMFQNRYWFKEVTWSAQGKQLYRCFQRAIGVLPVYREISEEVRELQNYYEGKVERSISRRLAFLTLVGLPAGLLTQMFGNFLSDQFKGWGWFWIFTAAMYAVVIALWFGIEYWAKRRK